MTGSGPGGPGESINWEEEAERLASRALAVGDATGWFEQLYAAGASGRVPVPWSRRDAHPLFVDWAQRRAVRGEGRRAVVVGCGLGADAEYTALLGFDTTGFDVSATAIRLAGQRFPHTMVHYQVAELLSLPAAWRHAFDLVSRSSRYRPSRAHPDGRPSRTSLAWLPPRAPCSSSPPFTTPTCRKAQFRPGRYGRARSTHPPPTA